MFKVCCFIAVLILLYSQECNARDALKYFVKHQHVKDFKVTVLNSTASHEAVWVEYKYYFNDNSSKSVGFQSGRFSLEGKVLRMGIFSSTMSPFDCTITSSSEKLEMTGYSFDVIKLLQEILQFRAEYVILNTTIKMDTISVSDYLLSNKTDIILCHPDVNYISVHNTIPIYPTIKSKYVMIYQLNKLYFTTDIFILTFAGSLWLCFFVLLVVLAICLRLSTTQYSIINSTSEPWSWVEITLWAIAAACQQGLYYVPNGFASRCIFFFGYLTAYLLYTGFAAAITSLLVQQDVSYHLTVEDLEVMEFNIVMLTGTKELEHKYVYLKNSLRVNDLDHFFLELDHSNTVGIAPNILVDQYFARNFDYKSINLYSTSILPDVTYSKGFLVQKNTTLAKVFNYGLLKLNEHGLLTETLQRNLLFTPVTAVTTLYSNASLAHVGSAILILLIGILCAIAFLLAELLFMLYKRYHKLLNKERLPMDKGVQVM